jgi:hypothetical protein
MVDHHLPLLVQLVVVVLLRLHEALFQHLYH